MHDTLEYFQAPPEQRTTQYHKLTFSMMYFYNEHYLLPFSHDEVVHGKATILNKMNGGYEDKFPQARAMYLYMMVHPGKKLNFMGNLPSGRKMRLHHRAPEQGRNTDRRL